jgi:WD40 repeat protein
MPSMSPENRPEELPSGQEAGELPHGDEGERTFPEPPLWPVATANRGRVRSWRPLSWGSWLIAAVVVLVLVLGTTLTLLPLYKALEQTYQGDVHAPTVITIDPTTHIACPLDAAWSPNGRYIAVLGYQVGCPNSNPSKPYDSGQVSIYNAGASTLVRSLSLDEGVVHSLRMPLGPMVTRSDGSVFAPFIGYQSVLWSPDGNQLAFPFVVLQAPHVFPAPNVPPQKVATSPTTEAGVLLFGLDKKLTVSGIQVHTMAPSTPPRTGYPVSIEWDLQTGSGSTLTLPPALSYTWGDRGRVVPVEPLNSTSAPAVAPSGSVGKPVGGRTFTIWQPGLASQGYYLNQMGGNGPSTPTYVPGVDLWYSSFAIWSPDGRYLISPNYYGGRMALSGQPVPNPVALQATGQGQVPVFTPHDTALQAAYLSTKDAPAAWRPDGYVLAVLSYKTANGQTPTAEVTLWECIAPTVLKTFTAKAASSRGPIFGLDGLVGSSTLAATLRWSPDGSHLLLLNSLVDSRITIWPVDYEQI